MEVEFKKSFTVKISFSQLDTQDVPYDYDSIMHYNDRAFSKNGSKTIIAPPEKTDTMGKMDALSRIDVQELGILYECKGKNIRRNQTQMLESIKHSLFSGMGDGKVERYIPEVGTEQTVTQPAIRSHCDCKSGSKV